MMMITTTITACEIELGWDHPQTAVGVTVGDVALKLGIFVMIMIMVLMLIVVMMVMIMAMIMIVTIGDVLLKLVTKHLTPPL